MRNIRKFLLALLCALIVSTGWSPIGFAQDEIQPPTAEDLRYHYPTIILAIEDAWTDTVAYGLEEGGWIYQNTTTGELKVVRVKRGTDIKIDVPFPEPEEGWRAVGFFHTHPPKDDDTKHKWKWGPSDIDTDPNNSLGVPELVRDKKDYWLFGNLSGGVYQRPTPTPELDVSIVPSSATIVLGETHMPSLNVLLNGDPIDSQKYTFEWNLDVNSKMSTEPTLTEEVFLQAVGSKPGEYLVYLFVEDKVTGKRVDFDVAKVIVKGVEGRWVSATPGKGMVYHQPEGKPQYTPGNYIPMPGTPAMLEECDVDLRVTGSTGSLTLTVTYTMDLTPGKTGSKVVYSIENWTDNGITTNFNVVSKYGSRAYQLTRAPSGHLTGRFVLSPATESVPERVETWDLMPVLPVPAS